MTGKENNMKSDTRGIYVHPLGAKKQQKDIPFANIGGGMSFHGKLNTLKSFFSQATK